jgi:hypothetical protein
MGFQQKLFLLCPSHRLDAALLLQGVAPRSDLAGPHEHDRQAGPGISRRPPGPVLFEAFFQVLGDPGVERAVAATEDVDVRHGGIIEGVPLSRLCPRSRELSSRPLKLASPHPKLAPPHHDLAAASTKLAERGAKLAASRLRLDV